MSEIINDTSKMLSAHWPFFAVFFILMVIGQLSKTIVFTRKRAEETHSKWYGHFWWWGRKSLPMHPMITGLLIGVIWTNPNTIIKDMVSAMFYFAFSGTLSVWGYQIIKGLLKKKSIDLSLPGNDNVVPAKTNGSSK
jgi:hypothetical protein